VDKVPLRTGGKKAMTEMSGEGKAAGERQARRWINSSGRRSLYEIRGERGPDPDMVSEENKTTTTERKEKLIDARKNHAKRTYPHKGENRMKQPAHQGNRPGHQPDSVCFEKEIHGKGPGEKREGNYGTKRRHGPQK